MSGDLFIDIHGVLQIEVRGLYPSAARALRSTFAPFIVSQLSQHPHIVVSPLDDSLADKILTVDTKNLTRYWVHEMSPSEFALVSCYRGSVDMFIELGEPLQHFFSLRFNNSDRLVDSLYLSMIIAFQRRNAMLFKGAVVCRENLPVVLSGVSGAGKTSLMLHLLHDGWDYLSDNTCLLHEAATYSFRKKVVYNYHHVEAYPHLFEQGAVPRSEIRKAPRINWLRDLSRKYLPSYLLNSPRVKNAADPYLSKPPETLFPRIQVLDRVKPRLFLLLSPGRKLSHRPIESADAIRRLKLLHRVSWPDYHALSDLFQFITGRELIDFEIPLKANLASQVFYQMTVPGGESFQETYAYLVSHVDEMLNHACRMSSSLN